MSTDKAILLNFPAKELPTNYEGFVFANWLHSFRKYNSFLKKADVATYFKEYREFIEKLLKKPDSKVRLAVLEDDKDIVLGFAVSREDVLDYVYVPFHLRGNKMSTLLIPEGITTFTHCTNLWYPIWQAKYKDWKFKPSI